jgi:hypothetical protein
VATAAKATKETPTLQQLPDGTPFCTQARSSSSTPHLVRILDCRSCLTFALPHTLPLQDAPQEAGAEVLTQETTHKAPEAAVAAATAAAAAMQAPSDVAVMEGVEVNGAAAAAAAAAIMGAPEPSPPAVQAVAAEEDDYDAD